MFDTLKKDKNFFFLDSPHLVLSIFDHTVYDRSDIDLLSEAQRKYLINKLKKFGFKQQSGRAFHSTEHTYKFKIPKQSIIAASPVQIVKNEKRKKDEILVLTPTQMACYIILKFDDEKVLIYLKKLIKEQPVNLKKIKDHLRIEKQNDLYLSFFNELITYQSDCIENSDLKYKNHIGKFF